MTCLATIRTRCAELRLDLLALLWPSRCVVCGGADRVCCASCLAGLRGRDGADATVRLRLLPRAGARGPLRLRAAGTYDGALRAVLVAYKHAGRTGLARPLGARLRPALAAALREASTPILVAIPSRPSRVRERGYRHLEPVVRSALREHRGAERPALDLRALRTTRGRRSQVGLDRAARRGNAARIAVRSSAAARMRGRNIVLVDDVCTSGATFEAAADALEMAGARVVSAVSICVVEENAEPGGNRARESDKVPERRNGAPGRRPPA